MEEKLVMFDVSAFEKEQTVQCSHVEHMAFRNIRRSVCVCRLSASWEQWLQALLFCLGTLWRQGNCSSVLLFCRGTLWRQDNCNRANVLHTKLTCLVSVCLLVHYDMSSKCLTHPGGHCFLLHCANHALTLKKLALWTSTCIYPSSALLLPYNSRNDAIVWRLLSLVHDAV